MRAVLSERQRRILAGDLNPKFLATVDASGEPNVVPLLSLTPVEPGVVGFAEFMMWKTKQNLTATGVAALTALDGRLGYFTARARLRGFENAGDLFETMARLPMFAHNPYNGIRAAGALELEETGADGRLPPLQLLLTHLRAARLAQAATSGGAVPGPRTVPRLAAEKFGRLKAVKAVAWPVERAGGPSVDVLPAGGVAPVGETALVVADPSVASAVPEGSRVAVAVITADPVAYQVKGVARRWRGSLLVQVTHSYSASPPLPGKPLL